MTLQEQIRDKVKYMAEQKPYLYGLIQQRCGSDVESFIVECALEYYDENDPTSQTIVAKAMDIAIVMFERMLAGNVYKNQE